MMPPTVAQATSMDSTTPSLLLNLPDEAILELVFVLDLAPALQRTFRL